MKSVQAICTVERLAIKMRFKVEQERTGFHFCMLYRCNAFCTPLDFFLMYSTQTYLENAETFLLPKRWLSIIIAE